MDNILVLLRTVSKAAVKECLISKNISNQTMQQASSTQQLGRRPMPPPRERAASSPVITPLPPKQSKTATNSSRSCVQPVAVSVEDDDVDDAGSSDDSNVYIDVRAPSPASRSQLPPKMLAGGGDNSSRSGTHSSATANVTPTPEPTAPRMPPPYVQLTPAGSTITYTRRSRPTTDRGTSTSAAVARHRPSNRSRRSNRSTGRGGGADERYIDSSMPSGPYVLQNGGMAALDAQNNDDLNYDELHDINGISVDCSDLFFACSCRLSTVCRVLCGLLLNLLLTATVAAGLYCWLTSAAGRIDLIGLWRPPLVESVSGVEQCLGKWSSRPENARSCVSSALNSSEMHNFIRMHIEDRIQQETLDFRALCGWSNDSELAYNTKSIELDGTVARVKHGGVYVIYSRLSIGRPRESSAAFQFTQRIVRRCGNPSSGHGSACVIHDDVKTVLVPPPAAAGEADWPVIDASVIVGVSTLLANDSLWIQVKPDTAVYRDDDTDSSFGLFRLGE